jgi:C1A family cysteine protease
MAALMKAPIIVGVNWYEGFDYPNSKGLVKVAGEIRGGHEFCLFGLDAKRQIVYARNSWGKGWGAGGNFNFSFSDLQRLLNENGDATVFIPMGSKVK